MQRILLNVGVTYYVDNQEFIHIFLGEYNPTCSTALGTICHSLFTTKWTIWCWIS